VRDIIVIGASAGGVEALREFVARLPATFPGSIFVSVHFPEHATSSLPSILARSGSLPALHPSDGDAIVPGRIVVAPPDHHLMFSRTAVHLVRGPRENGNRPAADPMFRSAALTFGPRVIGVALTGNLNDGTSGLAAIKRAGGLAVVQDPQEALFSSMPRSAIDHVPIDRVVSIRDLANTLTELMAVPLPQRDVAGAISDDDKENELSAVDLHQVEAYEQNPGRISSYSCPDCGGVLRELHDGRFIRFRCRVGHAWTGDALLVKQRHVMDDAL
jgi:two-component system chemotaxis response regulator CheB